MALDFIATFAFALVGAHTAVNRGMDVGGILFVAGVSALSGGTFRNMALQIHPAWIDRPYLLFAVIAAFLATLISKRSGRVGKYALALDSLGLGFAVVAAAQIAVAHHLMIGATLVLAVLSGVLGGLIRDVLCQVPPVLLHRETNGSAALIGAITFIALCHTPLTYLENGAISGLLVVLIRLLSIKFRWNLPRISRRQA
jgi:uncharacterized membrane protein YeiH